MNYNVDKFKGYRACKLISKTFDTILDAFDVRCQVENLVPGFTFSKRDYGQGIDFSAKTYYVSDGFDFSDVDKIHDSTDISVAINKNKLDAYLEDDNNESFENINQALLIMAVGNIHDILRSENFIKATLYKNKAIKKEKIITHPSFRLSATISGVKECFGDFSKQVDRFFDSAHKYASQNPVM